MNYCGNDFIKFYELFGIILLLIKCIIPLLIIIFGTMDFFGIVIKNKDNKKNINKFIRRIVVGIIIFFIPSIIIEIFDRIGLDKSEYSCMYECVLDISKCDYKK